MAEISALIERLEQLQRQMTTAPWEAQTGCSWRRIGSDFHDGNVLCPTNSRTDNHPDLIVREDDLFGLVDLRNALPDILAALRSDAATIADLREKVRVLRKAVKPFAEVADGYEPNDGDDGDIAWADDFTIGSCRRARDAYAATESEG